MTTPPASENLTPYVPEDFDDFWAETVELASAVPLSYVRSRRNDYDLPGFRVETIDFTGMDGQEVHGWIAVPEELVNRSPGFLWLPAYGRWSHVPDEYSTQPGFVSMSLNLHGESAFHHEDYTPSRGYFSDGIEDPRTWCYRRMEQNVLIAMRVLEAQLEVDEERIAACGLSKGGGMAIWTGWLFPRTKCVIADLPFLSAMKETLGREIYRYPLKEIADHASTIPLGMERVMNTVAYFDSMNHATRLNVPTQVSLGMKDPAVRPENVRATYAALGAEKRLVEYETGHDWNTQMVAANRSWLMEHLI